MERRSTAGRPLKEVVGLWRRLRSWGGRPGKLDSRGGLRALAKRGVKHLKQWSRPGSALPCYTPSSAMSQGLEGCGVRVMCLQGGGRASGEEHPVPTLRPSVCPILSDACGQTSSRRQGLGERRDTQSCPRAQRPKDQDLHS